MTSFNFFSSPSINAFQLQNWFLPRLSVTLLLNPDVHFSLVCVYDKVILDILIIPSFFTHFSLLLAHSSGFGFPPVFLYLLSVLFLSFLNIYVLQGLVFSYSLSSPWAFCSTLHSLMNWWFAHLCSLDFTSERWLFAHWTNLIGYGINISNVSETELIFFFH